MQFYQKVEQYHLTVNHIVITKSDFLWVLAVQTPCGAKQSSINYEVLQSDWPEPQESI